MAHKAWHTAWTQYLSLLHVMTFSLGWVEGRSHHKLYPWPQIAAIERQKENWGNYLDQRQQSIFKKSSYWKLRLVSHTVFLAPSLPNSAIIAWKEPHTICKPMGMAVFQQNIIYKNGMSQIWSAKPWFRCFRTVKTTTAAVNWRFTMAYHCARHSTHTLSKTK